MPSKEKKDIKPPKQAFKHDPGDVPKLIAAAVIGIFLILALVITLSR